MTIVNDYLRLKPLTLVVCMMLSDVTYADIDVELAADDEVIISNTTANPNATFSLAEPPSSLMQAKVLATLAQLNVPINNTVSFKKLPYQAEVQQAAAITQLDPALIHAVIAVESKHRPNARSKKGALGLMQLMPSTAKRFNVGNELNPLQNVMAGAQYLRELINLFDGNVALGLAAYNAGPGAVKKYKDRIPPFKETQDYVPRVLSYYKTLKSS